MTATQLLVFEEDYDFIIEFINRSHTQRLVSFTMWGDPFHPRYAAIWELDNAGPDQMLAEGLSYEDVGPVTTEAATLGYVPQLIGAVGGLSFTDDSYNTKRYTLVFNRYTSGPSPHVLPFLSFNDVVALGLDSHDNMYKDRVPISICSYFAQQEQAAFAAIVVDRTGVEFHAGIGHMDSKTLWLFDHTPLQVPAAYDNNRDFSQGSRGWLMSASTLVRILSMMHPNGPGPKMDPAEVRLMMRPNPFPGVGDGGHVIPSPQGPNMYLWHQGEWRGTEAVAGFFCPAAGPDHINDQNSGATRANWAIALNMNLDTNWLNFGEMNEILSIVMGIDALYPFDAIPYQTP